MNRAALSLCLLGAGLSTANILIMQRPTCPSAGAALVTAGKAAPPSISRATQGKPALAAKPEDKEPAKAPKAKVASPTQGKPEQTQKAALTKPVASPKHVDRTGSIDLPEKPNSAPTASGSRTEQSQKSAQRETKLPNDPSLIAPAKPRSYDPRPYDRRYEPRRYGWKRYYRYVGPPVGFAIRVYPGW
jgi:hypothetical protein